MLQGLGKDSLLTGLFFGQQGFAGIQFSLLHQTLVKALGRYPPLFQDQLGLGRGLTLGRGFHCLGLGFGLGYNRLGLFLGLGCNLIQDFFQWQGKIPLNPPFAKGEIKS